MTNKSKKEYAYTMIDIEGRLNEEIKEKLGTIKEVLRVRVIEQEKGCRFRDEFAAFLFFNKIVEKFSKYVTFF